MPSALRRVTTDDKCGPWASFKWQLVLGLLVTRLSYVLNLLDQSFFVPAELKILDDPLPFKRKGKKSDKDEEEVANQDVSTDVMTL